MQIDIHEAADVWNLTSLIRNSEQRGKTQNIEQGFGGCGDSKHYLEWAADIRKLVDNELEAEILDSIYGDTPHPQKHKVKIMAHGLLGKFTKQLRLHPDRYEDYNKYRKQMLE